MCVRRAAALLGMAVLTDTEAPPSSDYTSVRLRPFQTNAAEILERENGQEDHISIDCALFKLFPLDSTMEVCRPTCSLVLPSGDLDTYLEAHSTRLCPPVTIMPVRHCANHAGALSCGSFQAGIAPPLPLALVLLGPALPVHVLDFRARCVCLCSVCVCVMCV